MAKTKKKKGKDGKKKKVTSEIKDWVKKETTLPNDSMGL